MISNNAYVKDITMYMSLVSIYYVDSIDRVNKVLLTLLLNITTTHQRGTTQIINQQLP